MTGAALRRKWSPRRSDPIYSGKGLAGLIARICEGRWSVADDVVSVRTGGAPALFAYRKVLDL